MEKDVSLKSDMFLPQCLLSQSSNRAEACHSLPIVQWKLPCLCLLLSSVHVAKVGCALCVLHEFADDHSLLMAVTLHGLCSLNVLYSSATSSLL